MTTCCLPVPSVIPLHTPWWRLVLQALPAWTGVRRPVPAPVSGQPERWTAAQWRTLSHLNTGTLRDIGAPEWVYAGREAQQRAALDLLRL